MHSFTFKYSVMVEENHTLSITASNKESLPTENDCAGCFELSSSPMNNSHCFLGITQKPSSKQYVINKVRHFPIAWKDRQLVRFI